MDGVKSGYGEFFFANRNLYKGEFYNNEFHGNGSFYWNDGKIYVG